MSLVSIVSENEICYFETMIEDEILLEEERKNTGSNIISFIIFRISFIVLCSLH